MPVHFFVDDEGNWDPWTLRAREGEDTPSWEEYFWYSVTPGSWLKTARSDDYEMVDYAVTNMLMTVGSFALAGNAIMAAEAAGTTAILSEFTMARGVTSISVGLPLAFSTTAIAAMTIAFARAQRDYTLYRRAVLASGMDPGSMTQPLYQPTSPGITY